jgi:hypothetical protein
VAMHGVWYLEWVVTPRLWRPHTQSSPEHPGWTTHLSRVGDLCRELRVTASRRRPPCRRGGAYRDTASWLSAIRLAMT